MSLGWFNPIKPATNALSIRLMIGEVGQEASGKDSIAGACSAVASTHTY